jgi:uncharacterized membrane protein
MMNVQKFFTAEEKKQIVQSIREAELHTSGEIRLHVEASAKEPILDRAAAVFKQLKMHRTALRNGVLFYLAVKNREFAILGDTGMNAKVPENFWEETKETVIQSFKEEKYAEGLIKGILMAGQQLKTFFPYQVDDINELDDEISFGKN